MISLVKPTLLAFAAFLVVGGILGFMEKHSAMSLIGGVGCAALAVFGALSLPTKTKLGLGLGVASAIVAAGRPLSTLSKAPLKLWPGGALLGFSAVVLVLCIAALVLPKSNEAR
jgi:uncharacterized membrane protein (UPF0136 family)